MATYIVTGIVLVAVLAALISGMWKASKYLVIPTQILIFLALIFIVVKVFFNWNNVKTLNSEIEKSGIVDSQKTAAQSIVDNAKNSMSDGGQTQKPAAEPQQTSAVSVQPVQRVGVEVTPAPEPPAEKKKKVDTGNLIDLL